MQDSIWTYYQARSPGEVQVLGPDLWNGTQAQLGQFRAQTRATYPLILCGACGAGNENLLVPYGGYDDYVVINKQGIIRYHALDLWELGDRFHLDEIRGAVDSLIAGVVGVDEGAASRRFLLDALPNPFSTATTVELTNPTGRELPARVTLFDLAGRRVATLWDAPAPGGVTRLAWEGRDESGAVAGPGVYLIRAQVGSTRLSRRLVRLR